MIEEIQAALSAEVERIKAERGPGEDGEINENVAVADLVYSYNNAKLIHALKERGTNIAL